MTSRVILAEFHRLPQRQPSLRDCCLPKWWLTFKGVFSESCSLWLPWALSATSFFITEKLEFCYISALLTSVLLQRTSFQEVNICWRVLRCCRHPVLLCCTIRNVCGYAWILVSFTWILEMVDFSGSNFSENMRACGERENMNFFYFLFPVVKTGSFQIKLLHFPIYIYLNPHKSDII